jgi:aryl-alcohol dehydrogenase
VRGCIQGDAPADAFWAVVGEHWRRGRLAVERGVGYYDFAEVNRAVADSLSGKTVKPVLRISSSTS